MDSSQLRALEQLHALTHIRTCNQQRAMSWRKDNRRKRNAQIQSHGGNKA